MAAASPPFHHRPQQRPMNGSWALRTHLELGALRGAVPCARLHARHVLWEWGLSDLDEPVELVVSELVTNAIQASVGLSSEMPGYEEESLGLPCVWLWLASDGRQLVVEVGDGSPRAPALAETEQDVEGGRGLLLVEIGQPAVGLLLPRRRGREPAKDHPQGRLGAGRAPPSGEPHTTRPPTGEGGFAVGRTAKPPLIRGKAAPEKRNSDAAEHGDHAPQDSRLVAEDGLVDGIVRHQPDMAVAPLEGLDRASILCSNRCPRGGGRARGPVRLNQRPQPPPARQVPSRPRDRPCRAAR